MYIKKKSLLILVAHAITQNTDIIQVQVAALDMVQVHAHNVIQHVMLILVAVMLLLMVECAEIVTTLLIIHKLKIRGPEYGYDTG